MFYNSLTRPLGRSHTFIPIGEESIPPNFLLSDRWG